VCCDDVAVMSVAIIDTGCANLASVGFAIDRLGVPKTITKDAVVIARADRVILPGVGAAPYAVQQLQALGLMPTIKALTQPVLGICLGMQLIFERSAEGDTSCLGLVDGEINLLDTGGLPSPHMGWNTLEDCADDPLLAGISDGDYVYFVHTYAAPVSTRTLATTSYGSAFSAIVRQNNIYGCQFHPETSGRVGARILKNFMKVKPS